MVGQAEARLFLADEGVIKLVEVRAEEELVVHLKQLTRAIHQAVLCESC